MIAFVLYDRATERRLAAAFDALTADAKARRYERAGHAVRVDGVTIVARRRRDAPPVGSPSTDQRVDVPAGYRIRAAYRVKPSTARRPLVDEWIGALWEITEAGDWTAWGEGHTTSPITGALERRGLIEVAEPIRGRRRLLYRATPAGQSVLGQRGAAC